jgi:flagellar motor switch protein FliM
MTIAAFDFRKPPPGELGRQANKWLTAACKRATASWSRALPYPTELALGPVEVVSAGVGLDSFPDDATAIPLNTPAAADGTVLLVFSRPVLLALLAGLVGETPTALPADRDLTELELSLIGFLAQELFLDALEKSWPTVPAPKLTPGAPTSPRIAWTGGENDLALFTQLKLTAPFGEHPVYLLVPRTGIWAKLGASPAKPKPPAAAPSEQIQALVREMAVELTVVLGSAELSMQDLANLTAGDVVVLRQKVDRPLEGQLSGMPKFRVWPGVIGDRVAVVIDAPADKS